MNWGILATGTIANKFATTINAMAAEGERLAAVGSRRAESAKAFAAQYNIPHWYASYEELAADPAVDAIYIATPNALHYENCKLCLEHGKHVLCEKPFTINAEQAKELYALAEKKQLFIMEAFWIRFLPLYAKLQQMLADGVIGTLQTITCQYGFTTEGARRERKFTHYHIASADAAEDIACEVLNSYYEYIICPVCYECTNCCYRYIIY